MMMLDKKYTILALSFIFSTLSIIGIVIKPHGAVLVTLTDPIIFEFLFGCIIAQAYLDGMRLPRLVCFLLIVIGVAGLLLSGFLVDNSFPRVLRYGLPAFALVCGTVAAERFIDFTRSRTLLHIGDSSYSIYLSHAFILPVAAIVLKIPGTHSLEGALLIPGFVAVCLLGGWVCYIALEKPLLNRLTLSYRRISAARAVPVNS